MLVAIRRDDRPILERRVSQLRCLILLHQGPHDCINAYSTVQRPIGRACSCDCMSSGETHASSPILDELVPPHLISVELLPDNSGSELSFPETPSMHTVLYRPRSLVPSISSRETACLVANSS